MCLRHDYDNKTNTTKTKSDDTYIVMTTICASCTSFSVDSPTLNSSKRKPQWLDEHDFVSDFIQGMTHFKPRKPASCDQQIDFNMGKKCAHRTILYWAADSSTSLVVQGAKKAYNGFKNHGVAKLDANGCAKLYLRCPQIYTTTKKGKSTAESFYRHFHVVMANKQCDAWLSQMYTQVIVCKRSLQYVTECLREGDAVILNALPCEYYGKDHIPGSYNLTATQVKKMSADALGEWVLSLCKLHYPKLYRMVKSGKMDVNEIPVICYCAHSGCNASELLEKELLKKGMVRVDSFPGGMKEYRK